MDHRQIGVTGRDIDAKDRGASGKEQLRVHPIDILLVEPLLRAPAPHDTIVVERDHRVEALGSLPGVAPGGPPIRRSVRRDDGFATLRSLDALRSKVAERRWN